MAYFNQCDYFPRNLIMKLLALIPLLFSLSAGADWSAMDLRYMSGWMCPDDSECRYVDTAAPNTFDWSDGVLFVDGDADYQMSALYLDTWIAVENDNPINIAGRFYTVAVAGEGRVLYVDDARGNPWSVHFDHISADTLKFLLVNDEDGRAVRFIFDSQ